MTVRMLPLFATVIVVAGTVLPGAATAAPEDVPALADSPTLSLRTLGSEPDIALYGVEGVQTMSVPVQPGLSAAELVATAVLPVNARGGTLEVTQENRTLARIPLPPDQGRIAIPLAAARVVDNAVMVSLRSYLTLPDGYCGYDAANPLRLVDAAIRYTGQELPPATIADFLPPVLQKLTLFVPPNPSKAESDAALRLVTATVARYGLQRTAVDLVPTDGGPVPPPAPMERQIIIREGQAPGLSLEGPNIVPALLVSGPVGELTNQARLLSSDISKLAVRSKAVAGPLSTTPQLPGDLTTIRRLGQPGVNATALANPRVTVPLDQTRLGRSVHGVRVQLQGSYTPLPSSVAGQVVVSIGGQTIDRWATEPDGRIDRWIDVPDHSLQRYINLDIAVNAAGNTGRCGEFEPITLTIDGATAVESKLAKPPFPGGFQALPQALMPRLEVGIDDGFANLRRAALILTGLQRLSALPFDTAVVSRQDAITSSNPAIVVSPDHWDADSIALPVSVDSQDMITVENADDSGTSSTLTLDPTIGFGSLQTLYSGGRTLLVATSTNTPDELDRLLGWLNGDTARWSGLTGNALIAVADRDPIQVNAETAQPESVTASSGRKALYLGIGAVVVVMAALGAGAIAWRGRRSRG
ncbi:hypothetical protein [Mycobacterium sp. 141]|uniref:hypothetical protein n=1 Tax=Mycobacterium sp. 141 TaxID=1120797 RepID=UPI001E5B7E25|nr:hypothetical protein [Mycobacterium sp. 141]